MYNDILVQGLEQTIEEKYQRQVLVALGLKKDDIYELTIYEQLDTNLLTGGVSGAFSGAAGHRAFWSHEKLEGRTIFQQKNIHVKITDIIVQDDDLFLEVRPVIQYKEYGLPRIFVLPPEKLIKITPEQQESIRLLYVN